MTVSEPTNVLTAFEMLLEEIENEIEYINEVGSKSFATRDYSRVEMAHQKALKLSEFRDNTVSLRHDWHKLIESFGQTNPENEDTDSDEKQRVRARRGQRTREEAFRIPILSAIQELGGSASTRDVLKVVEQRMKGQLKSVDYEAVPSNPNMLRWYNTAQWSRNTLVTEKLMKSDSPYGVWEISDLGIRLLSKQLRKY